tara:strand:- start:24 stop:158 length:135 start_codon:yes stop_codon:yes gene_type:complete
MPVVDGKHYPYTEEGKRRAKKAKKGQKKKGIDFTEWVDKKQKNY